MSAMHNFKPPGGHPAEFVQEQMATVEQLRAQARTNAIVRSQFSIPSMNLDDLNKTTSPVVRVNPGPDTPGGLAVRVDGQWQMTSGLTPIQPSAS